MSLLDGFVAAGFITAEEAAGFSVLSAIRSGTDRELVEEMLRRIVDGEQHEELIDPVDSDVINDIAAARKQKVDVSRYEKDVLPDEKLAANTHESARDKEPDQL